MAELMEGGSVSFNLLNVLSQKIASPEVVDFCKRKKLNYDMLKELERKINVIIGGLGDAEEKQLSEPQVKDWLIAFGDASYDADDWLDEITYEAQRTTREGGDTVPLLEAGNSSIDVGNRNGNDHQEVSSGAEGSNQMATKLQRIFLFVNFLLEIPSAVFDQLSSVHKPQYALITMLMSLAMMLITTVELVYKGRRQRVTWRLRGWIPWFYYRSPSHKRFGTLADIIGLVFAIFQSVFATIAYIFLSRHAENPINISFWPLVFALGLLCSKLLENPRREHARTE